MTSSWKFRNTHAREHADASGYLTHEEPVSPIGVSIDLEQETRLDDREERIRKLEREEELVRRAESARSSLVDQGQTPRRISSITGTHTSRRSEQRPP